MVALGRLLLDDEFLFPDSRSNGGGWLRIAAFIVLLALIAAAYIALRRGGNDFKINCDGHTINFKGKLPPFLRSSVSNFLLEAIPAGQRVTVRGNWHAPVPRLRIAGGSPGDRQRIRNGILMLLRR